ncbi:MAG: ATP-binding protein [Actinomycetota bacterium]
MNHELNRRWQLERWISLVRLVAFPWALLEISVFTASYPSRGYEVAAWLTTVALGVGAGAFYWLARHPVATRLQPAICLGGLVFDTAVIWAYAFIYTFEPGTPIRQLLFLPVVEAALRYGLLGGLAMPFAQIPVLIATEWWRGDHFAPPKFKFDHLTFPLGLQLAMGAIIGWLVNKLGREMVAAQGRASKAESLRDQLGRRVDLLDAANRCARALSSSLEIEEAFALFIRELRGLVPFDRTAIILAEEGAARVIAVAGAGAETVFPPGSRRPVAGSLLDHVIRTGQTVNRRDMADQNYAEEQEFTELGLRSLLAAPLVVGARTVGMVSLVRVEPDAFSDDEVELISLLGRFLGSAVQNIRAYEAERVTVEELRRLSALRADFVSMVSHELRSPMAAVIGSAKTLQTRWRELSPEQRESFLGLIEHETNRLAELVGDVLDTSRIESGSFSYSFVDVDLAELIQESAAAAESGQDEVRIHAKVHRPLPSIRGDRDRLRQVITNLIDNAVKYSPAGSEVEVDAFADNGQISVEVRDRGPGVAREHQSLIFEKFGRVSGENAKPGTGLGLFIARSIAVAHGGTLEVHSAPSEGATFALVLPVER